MVKWAKHCFNGEFFWLVGVMKNHAKLVRCNFALVSLPDNSFCIDTFAAPILNIKK